MTTFYTSDLHLGQTNMVQFRKRFTDCAHMDETIIHNWNRKVQPEDVVYIVGDLSFDEQSPVEEYLRRLSGRKHLIIGNHDQDWLKAMKHPEEHFESISDMLVLDAGDKNLTLCHYPMLEWYGTRYGKPSYLLHGHIHGRRNLKSFQFIKEHLPNALNVGVDVNNYEPVTFEELLENNKKWYAMHR